MKSESVGDAQDKTCTPMSVNGPKIVTWTVLWGVMSWATGPRIVHAGSLLHTVQSSKNWFRTGLTEGYQAIVQELSVQVRFCQVLTHACWYELVEASMASILLLLDPKYPAHVATMNSRVRDLTATGSFFVLPSIAREILWRTVAAVLSSSCRVLIRSVSGDRRASPVASCDGHDLAS